MDFKSWVRQQWDRFAGWVSIGLGAVALLLGWLGLSDSAYPAEQLPYILSGGVFGLFLLGLGAVLLISADLRDEWRKLDDIEDAIRSSATVATTIEEEPTATAAATAQPPSTEPALRNGRTRRQPSRRS